MNGLIPIRSIEQDNQFISNTASYASFPNMFKNLGKAAITSLSSTDANEITFNQIANILNVNEEEKPSGIINKAKYYYNNAKNIAYENDVEEYIEEEDEKFNKKLKETIILKILDPNCSKSKKEYILQNCDLFTQEEIDLYINNAPVTDPTTWQKFNNYMMNTPAAQVTGATLISLGFAGVYYLWKKWKNDKNNLTVDDIIIANKIDENTK